MNKKHLETRVWEIQAGGYLGFYKTFKLLLDTMKVYESGNERYDREEHKEKLQKVCTVLSSYPYFRCNKDIQNKNIYDVAKVMASVADIVEERMKKLN